MRLFVYGTLLANSDTPAARWLRTRVRHGCRASVSGRLFAIITAQGAYPALIPGHRAGRTFGMIYDLAMRPGDLAALDQYEGGDYRRRTVCALIERSPVGRRWTTTQVYAWRGRLPPGARRIAGDDFLTWLASEGRRAYTTSRVPGVRP